MDINRAELKGWISSEIITRTTANGSEWITFNVAVNDYDKRNNIHKDKSRVTWINIVVFNENLVQKIKRLKIKVGTHVWLVGKIASVQRNEEDGKIRYFSIVANEFEPLKTVRETEKLELAEQMTNSDNIERKQEIENDSF